MKSNLVVAIEQRAVIESSHTVLSYYNSYGIIHGLVLDMLSAGLAIDTIIKVLNKGEIK